MPNVPLGEQIILLHTASTLIMDANKLTWCRYNFIPPKTFLPLMQQQTNNLSPCYA